MNKTGCVSRGGGAHRGAPCKLLTLKHISVISALALCVCGLSRPAQAQIYSWKDANGIMVLSNVPHSGASVAPSGVTAKVSAISAPLLMSANPGYEPLIHEHSILQGVRAELIRAVIQVESAFNPRARSPKGAGFSSGHYFCRALLPL